MPAILPRPGRLAAFPGADGHHRRGASLETRRSRSGPVDDEARLPGPDRYEQADVGVPPSAPVRPVQPDEGLLAGQEHEGPRLLPSGRRRPGHLSDAEAGAAAEEADTGPARQRAGIRPP